MIKNQESKIKNQKSFTLIDVLVGTFLILIVFLGIFGAYQLSLKVVGLSKAKITATALANQKIELVRNLAYNDVGTIGGIPSGIIPQTETVTQNNINYTVKTTIVYIDDSFDGLAPDDTLSSDYKRVKVKVSWPGRFLGEISLITDVVPKGVESEIGGGTLSFTVFDASGVGISQANLHIINNQVIPAIDAWYQTDSYGDLIIPGAPASLESYQITASKIGYSTDRTYGKEEVESPSKPHATVFEGQVSSLSFSIDKVSSMIVETRGSKGQGYPPIHGVIFKMEGAKTVGNDEEGNPIYKYSQNHTTNGPGKIEISDLEWDSYSFYVDKSTTGLDLISIESPPGTETSQPVDLLPDSTKEVRLILKAENTFLVMVKDSSSGNPIFAASVRVYNTSLGYDQTQPTDEIGQTFFIPLEAAIYNLEITATGYQSYTGQVSVSGTTTETVNLVVL